jgi:hypothetical protein
MTDATNSTPNDRSARANHAFFCVEGEIHDLNHMASIAWTLFQDTLKGSSNGTGWRTVQMTEDEFGQLEFAISKTALMAGDLVTAFRKEFETEKKTQ